MKKLFVFFLFVLFFSCKNEDKVEAEIKQIPVTFNLERFDQLFFETKPEDLGKLKGEYPFLFPKEETDSVWIEFMTDSLFKEVSHEISIKYRDTKKLEGGLTDLFKHVQFYFPEYKTPKVITLVNKVDITSSAIYAPEVVLIALDCYLGKDHRYYTPFDAFQRIRLEENQILPDLVSSFSDGKIATPKNRNLLSLMIYEGKELYLKDKLLSTTSDAAKIAYTEEQLAWCKENEYQIWSYFISNNLLYESNVKNEYRFMNEAPFSKFYQDIDAESPGRVGQWIGWQIVRSYMENNNVTLNELLAEDAKVIFEKSKYKPNSNGN
ncbi:MULTISPECIES: gliding motility lipoprotein GldB [Flavobacterium]|uniref:Gliding motility lipoprotein GldB n=1 Tax=Flavobacterium jumunjinense TaxID=998845 RepID=A0ABV5GTL8_9FLAO|nr:MULTISPECIES: gliding motility lipoprotein GldB [Flavobacterium]